MCSTICHGRGRSLSERQGHGWAHDRKRGRRYARFLNIWWHLMLQYYISPSVHPPPICQSDITGPFFLLAGKKQQKPSVLPPSSWWCTSPKHRHRGWEGLCLPAHCWWVSQHLNWSRVIAPVLLSLGTITAPVFQSTAQYTHWAVTVCGGNTGITSR